MIASPTHRAGKRERGRVFRVVKDLLICRLQVDGGAQRLTGAGPRPMTDCVPATSAGDVLA